MTVPALTMLSEEERLLRDSVFGFARERVAPHVARMDQESRLEPSLLREMFQMGLMGIEIPEAHAGAGGTFMNAILAVEALARVDASLAVVVDVQNTLVNNALLRWGTAAQKQRYLPQLASEWVGSYALSEQGSGSGFEEVAFGVDVFDLGEVGALENLHGFLGALVLDQQT